MGPQPTGRASERTSEAAALQIALLHPRYGRGSKAARAVCPFLLPEAFSPSFLSFPPRAVPYEGINSNLIKSRQQRETSRRHPRLLPRCAETRNATAGTCKVHRTPSEPFAYFCLSVQSVYIVEPTFWLSEHRGNVPKMTAGEKERETPLRGSRSVDRAAVDQLCP